MQNTFETKAPYPSAAPYCNAATQKTNGMRSSEKQHQLTLSFRMYNEKQYQHTLSTNNTLQHIKEFTSDDLKNRYMLHTVTYPECNYNKIQNIITKNTEYNYKILNQISA
jgi:hypothetical protein